MISSPALTAELHRFRAAYNETCLVFGGHRRYLTDAAAAIVDDRDGDGIAMLRFNAAYDQVMAAKGPLDRAMRRCFDLLTADDYRELKARYRDLPDFLRPPADETFGPASHPEARRIAFWLWVDAQGVTNE